MTGPIAQLIALSLYGNAYQQGEKITDFFQHSTAHYCKHIIFSQLQKNMLGKFEAKLIYDNPNFFLEKMSETPTQFTIYYQPKSTKDGLDEMTSAAFIGGGGKWNLVSSHTNAVSVWTANWNVIDKDNPDNRIWGVNYVKTGDCSLYNESDEKYIDAFYTALEKVYHFTVTKNDSAFADNFKNAMTTLDSKGKTLFGYHKDLVPSCYKSIEYLLDACQSAWVFGGMMSWNDVYFEDDAVFEEYKSVSKELYSSLITTIIQSVNSVVNTNN
ncbi:MAG: hypothetical protein K6E51_05895 [Treponema sp.]|nr:hypothetical protein [Treponema sp.]